MQMFYRPGIVIAVLSCLQAFVFVKTSMQGLIYLSTFSEISYVYLNAEISLPSHSIMGISAATWRGEGIVRVS